MIEASAAGDLVILGRVVGVYGVHGWVKVYSYSRDKADILKYSRWLLRREPDWKEFAVREARVQGKGIIALLEGQDRPEQARTLIGTDIAVRRAELPALATGEYYWAELEGLKVINLDGVELGCVSHLLDTGANDVMVVTGERERLIPYVRGVVRAVDRAAGVIRVDWEVDF